MARSISVCSSCFNPRAPRGARLDKRTKLLKDQVSIHAPREGRDRMIPDLSISLLFQSTRPARGATLHRAKYRIGMWFQSTRPARGATG